MLLIVSRPANTIATQDFFPFNLKNIGKKDPILLNFKLPLASQLKQIKCIVSGLRSPCRLLKLGPRSDNNVAC